MPETWEGQFHIAPHSPFNLHGSAWDPHWGSQQDVGLALAQAAEESCLGKGSDGKELLSKHKDPNLIPRTKETKMPIVVACCCNPSAGETDRWIPGAG